MIDITFKNSNFITYILLGYYFSDSVSIPLKLRAVEGLAYLLTHITFFRRPTQKSDRCTRGACTRFFIRS